MFDDVLEVVGRFEVQIWAGDTGLGIFIACASSLRQVNVPTTFNRGFFHEENFM